MSASAFEAWTHEGNRGGILAIGEKAMTIAVLGVLAKARRHGQGPPLMHGFPG